MRTQRRRFLLFITLPLEALFALFVIFACVFVSDSMRGSYIKIGSDLFYNNVYSLSRPLDNIARRMARLTDNAAISEGIAAGDYGPLEQELSSILTYFPHVSGVVCYTGGRVFYEGQMTQIPPRGEAETLCGGSDGFMMRTAVMPQYYINSLPAGMENGLISYYERAAGSDMLVIADIFPESLLPSLEYPGESRYSGTAFFTGGGEEKKDSATFYCELVSGITAGMSLSTGPVRGDIAVFCAAACAVFLAFSAAIILVSAAMADSVKRRINALAERMDAESRQNERAD